MGSRLLDVLVEHIALVLMGVYIAIIILVVLGT